MNISNSPLFYDAAVQAVLSPSATGPTWNAWWSRTAWTCWREGQHFPLVKTCVWICTCSRIVVVCVWKLELVCIECYQFFPHYQGDDGEAGDPGPAGEPGIAVSHITFMPSSGLSKFILSFLRLLNLSRIVITFAGVSGSQRRCRRKGGFWSSWRSWPHWTQRNTRRRRTQRQPC